MLRSNFSRIEGAYWELLPNMAAGISVRESLQQ